MIMTYRWEGGFGAKPTLIMIMTLRRAGRSAPNFLREGNRDPLVIMIVISGGGGSAEACQLTNMRSQGGGRPAEATQLNNMESQGGGGSADPSKKS